MKSEYYDPRDKVKNTLMQWIQCPANASDPVSVANGAALLCLFVTMHRLITLADTLSDEGCEDAIQSIKSEVEKFISEHTTSI